jgi:ATP-dependent Zn protease
VAHHEAGHALVGWLLPHTDPVLKVSIIPRGQAALGFAMQLPEERYIHSIEYLQERMCVLLAGRAAEVAIFGEISSGAQDDLEKVTELAYSLMLSYGMNKDIGSLSFSERNNPGTSLGYS